MQSSTSDVPCLTRPSAMSLPQKLLCPGIQNSLTTKCLDILFKDIRHSVVVIDVVRTSAIDLMACLLSPVARPLMAEIFTCEMLQSFFNLNDTLISKSLMKNPPSTFPQLSVSPVDLSVGIGPQMSPFNLDWTRYLSSALIGILCGWLMCKCIFASVLISKKYESRILIFAIFIVAYGFVFTDSMKCIILMMFMSLLGKSGRSYMRALSFALVISGPIENLSSNTGEIVRTFSCSKILAINLTRTRFDLMTKPFHETLKHMKEDIKDVQETFSELKDVTKVLHEEVILENKDTNTNLSNTNGNKSTFVHKRYGDMRIIDILMQSDEKHNAEYFDKRYKNKLRGRCLKQLSNGEVRCRKIFYNALEKCYEKLPYILKTLICWPFKVDFICKINILGDPKKICDPSHSVPHNFGSNYSDLISTENQLYKDSSNVKVNYKIMSPEQMTEVKSAEKTAKYIANEFKLRKRIFDSILRILQQILGFMILRFIYVCIKYHKMYKNDLEHDNIYVTDYFKHLDLQRISKGKKSLLPLKKYERRSLIDTDHPWQRTHEESQSALYQLLQFLLEIICGCFFLFFDYVLVFVLLIIRKNSKMSFVQEGEHTIQFQIKGSGLIARLLRNTIGNFNMHETVSTYLTNEICLPNPNILPKSFYLKLFTLYTIALLLIYQSSTFLRFRRLICGYFYQKLEKKRILYLYNCLLKQRRSIKETMMKKAKYNFLNRQIRLTANLFLILRMKWPRYFNWLLKFHMGRRKCLICGAMEDPKFVFCRNNKCNVSYCNDCLNDIGNTCWICNDILSLEIMLNFNDFFEQFSFV
ncbi:ubiquitin protein ligase sneaky [Cochliomyia hominivorax]